MSKSFCPNAFEISTSLFINSSRAVVLILAFFLTFVVLLFSQKSPFLHLQVCIRLFKVQKKLVLSRAGPRWTSDVDQ